MKNRIVLTKIIIILLAFTLVVTGCFPVLSFAATNPDVTVNGTFVNWTDARPYIDGNNRTMVPLRASMEACGLKVTWDGNKREAAVTDGYTIVKVPIDKRVISINGKNKNIDTNAVIKGGRTYLPIRAVAEAFGYNVLWWNSDKLVSLIKLNREHDYVMSYDFGLFMVPLGEIGVYTNGVLYMLWYDENETYVEAPPVSMFTYNGETIIKYSDDTMIVINGSNKRLITYGDLLYLEEF